MDVGLELGFGDVGLGFSSGDIGLGLFFGDISQGFHFNMLSQISVAFSLLCILCKQKTYMTVRFDYK